MMSSVDTGPVLFTYAPFRQKLYWSMIDVFFLSLPSVFAAAFLEQMFGIWLAIVIVAFFLAPILALNSRLAIAETETHLVIHNKYRSVYVSWADIKSITKSRPWWGNVLMPPNAGSVWGVKREDQVISIPMLVTYHRAPGDPGLEWLVDRLDREGLRPPEGPSFAWLTRLPERGGGDWIP